MKNRKPIFPDKNKGCGRNIGRLILIISLALLLIGLCFGEFVWQSLNKTRVSIDTSPDDYVIFDDVLADGWYDDSFNDTWLNFVDGVQQSGSTGLRVDYGGFWGGLRLINDEPIDLETYQAVSFWVKLPLYNPPRLDVALVGETITSPATRITVNRGTWQQVIIPIVDLDAPNNVKGIILQNVSGEANQFMIVDDIRFLRSQGNIVTVPTKAFSVTVDLAGEKRPISPDIYGINFVDPDLAAEMSIPVTRWGGNATTRYNWEIDTNNRAFDWYFENIPNEVENENTLPFNSSSDRFIADNLQTDTDVIMTIPLIGWTPKARQFDCGYPVELYPNQLKIEDKVGFPCGNGLDLKGDAITGNDPELTSVAINSTFIKRWINHMTDQFGAAGNGGVRFYNLDNEPMLWHTTHQDVHPTPTGYDELLDRTLEYAVAIKEADPAAQTLGPVVYGWIAYFNAASDTQDGIPRNPKDRNAHGGLPLVPWYLEQLAQYEKANGVRLLDYLDLHYYAATDNVALAPAGNRDIMSRRMRSTRALWDVTYEDESWIKEPINLIPRMQEWVDDYYPETKLAITEYNFGALEHINGAVAQADVLGIFGREGVDLATMWDPEGNNDPWAFAFRMYRNYDGMGSQFGDVSVPVYSSNPDELSVYVAERTADNTLTVMVINKSWQPQKTTLNFANGALSGGVLTYRYSGADWDNIRTKASTFSGDNQFVDVFPAQSITLLEIR